MSVNNIYSLSLSAFSEMERKHWIGKTLESPSTSVFPVSKSCVELQVDGALWGNVESHLSHSAYLCV